MHHGSIVPLAFCRAENRFGTRNSMLSPSPLFLCLSFLRSVVPSLRRAFAIFRRGERDPFGPKSTSAFLSLRLLRELERAVRCSFVFRHSPLHLRSALFLKDRYSQQSPRDRRRRRRRRRRRLVLQIDAAASAIESRNVSLWNDMETLITSTFIVIHAARAIIDCNKLHVHRRSVGMRSRS